LTFGRTIFSNILLFGERTTKGFAIGWLTDLSSAFVLFSTLVSSDITLFSDSLLICAVYRSSAFVPS
jgi:hypothetical protein